MTKTSLAVLAALLPASAMAAPKNIIYMIGDGMGPAYLSAYRYYMDDPATKAVEATIFDELWVGVATTYPDDDTIVTDSAAGATALSTRHKSYNGAISVDHDHNKLTTMLEIAKHQGKLTGVVATAQINHATPAAFIAHNKTRKAYDEIANDYFDNKVDGKFVADLMFGGGTSYFERKDRNLAKQFKQAGYQYANSWQDFNNIKSLPALALLAPVGFPSTLDNPVQQPLVQMTEKALKLLNSSDKGFVVMIEGSQIDWCGHANDVACAMAEMHDFGNAIKAAKAFVDANPDTLLVITADHETGGLSLGANGIYAWNRDVIKAVKQTGPVLAKSLVKAKAAEQKQVWLAQTGLKLTDSEWQTLSQQINQLAPVYANKDWSKEVDVLEAEADLLEPLAKQAKKLVDKYSNTGWTSGAHTAIDVPVLAYGKDAQQFAGFQDNTAIASKLLNFIEKK
ncbi:alkaline phosphatase [Rheinheimera texasensis]|uniref:alkaline phosphatase n=1 Tax=Rheinheimera texasensis TaxID=306205 RepID=UPI0032B13E59